MSFDEKEPKDEEKNKKEWEKPELVVTPINKETEGGENNAYEANDGFWVS